MGLLRLKPNLQKFNSQDEEKKKKKKVKLEMHDQQIFKDGDEYYVWIYDPVPLKTFLIGLLLGRWLIESLENTVISCQVEGGGLLR